MAVHIASTDPGAGRALQLRRLAAALELDGPELEPLIEAALRRPGRASACGLLARRFLAASRELRPPAARLRLAAAPAAGAGPPPEGAQAARAALASLPPEERLALLLVVVEGLSWDEGAAALDMSRADFLDALGRARADLELRLRAREAESPAARPRLRIVP
jgi:RNA polymerase sigma-70 factor (ECF subfamily)